MAAPDSFAEMVRKVENRQESRYNPVHLGHDISQEELHDERERSLDKEFLENERFSEPEETTGNSSRFYELQAWSDEGTEDLAMECKKEMERYFAEELGESVEGGISHHVNGGILATAHAEPSNITFQASTEDSGRSYATIELQFVPPSRSNLTLDQYHEVADALDRVYSEELGLGL